MPPEPFGGSDVRLKGVLSRTAARIRLRRILRAGAVATLVGGLAQVLLGLSVVSLVVAIGLVFLGVFLAQRPAPTTRAAAVAIERAEPSLRNLVFTAAQLIESPEGTPPYMRARVLRDAAHRTAHVDLGKAVPLLRDALALGAAIAVFVLAISIRLPATSVLSPITTSPDRQVTKSTDLVVDLVPPAYSGRPASRLVNPAAIEVLAGTQAVLRPPVGTNGPIRVNGVAVPPGAEGTSRVTLVESGYIAIDGDAPRLVPLTVTPDRAPDVRITAPAKDLRVPSNAATIPIGARATDDLGLRSLELRYTVVSGSGEQFTFTEGALPAAIQRSAAGAWTLDATLSLAKLGLEAGDALIYRAVAADRRPGDAGTSTSDTFFVEVAGPGDVPLEGVEMPPDKERYALSQAMIVLKLERLQARERTLSREALTEAAGNIAAEQRAVRANFVFLLGGEVEDEEVEAEHSHEISEGRYANQARKEIVAATVLMTHVERALAALSTREALPPARAAVKALQRAFGHSRYLLRALPARVRLDPARRLSGDVTSAADWDRALAPPAPDEATATVRGALADLIAATAALDDPAARARVGGVLAGLGERILSAAAASPDLRPVANDIAIARQALAAGDAAGAREALRRAAAPLVTRAQHGRIPGRTVSRDAARLAGAAAVQPPGGGR